MILNGRELEFYRWDGELPELLAAVKTNLNKVAEVRIHMFDLFRSCLDSSIK